MKTISYPRGLPPTSGLGRGCAKGYGTPRRGQSVRSRRRRRRYADPPAAALSTGLGAGEWSPLRSRPYTGLVSKGLRPSRAQSIPILAAASPRIPGCIPTPRPYPKSTLMLTGNYGHAQSLRERNSRAGTENGDRRPRKTGSARCLTV
jgi:hypothetical protein